MTMLFTVYSVLCILCYVQCNMYIVHCVMYMSDVNVLCLCVLYMCYVQALCKLCYGHSVLSTVLCTLMLYTDHVHCAMYTV